MKRPPEIQINQFQLACLLDEEQMGFYKEVLADNVFCGHCGGVASKGIVVQEIFLTDLNDILVRGTCKVCNGKVARILEFGKDKAFYEKANDFRNSIRN
jgi:hypothetical protein